MKKIKTILRLIRALAIIIHALWVVLLATVHFALGWLFVLITAIIDILMNGFWCDFFFTKRWAKKIKTPVKFVEATKYFLKCTSEKIKIMSTEHRRGKRIKYCGECEKFACESSDDYGICMKDKGECYCLDKCHLTHYDFDLCCNEQCPKRHECKRYTTYKQGGWLIGYVMHGCIDGTLFIKEK